METPKFMELVRKLLIWIVRFIAYWYNNQGPQAGADEEDDSADD